MIASESDSASQPDEIRRRRRPFKKPIIPSMPTSLAKFDQPIKLIRCSSMKVSSSTPAINTNVPNRRHNTRNQGNSRLVNIDDDPPTPTSASSLALPISNITCIGKRKRSRAIVHDDFRLRNNSLHDYDMACVDETNL